MNQRRMIAVGVALAALAAAPASARSGYRIALTNGSTIVAADSPVRRGTILTFHQAATGALTGIPAEEVVAIEVASAPVRPRPLAQTRLESTPAPAFRPLEPGEILVIGATGDGARLPSSPPNAGNATNAGGLNLLAASGGGNPALYGNANINVRGLGPNGVPTVPSSTDLSQALASTTGANGFPAAATTAPTTIGPNGTPTLSPGLPGANTATGPNGTPLAAAAAQPATGTNGTPVLAQPAAAGATSTTIGPNGTPILAQPGTPGATAPPIGPNGTPVLAPAGSPGSAPPSTGSNGTPNTAAGPGAH